MNGFKRKLVRTSGVLCSLAVMLAAMLATGCRSNWYQPEEPDDLEKLFNKTMRKSG